MPGDNDQKELVSRIGFLEAELDSLSAKLRGMTGVVSDEQEGRYGWHVPIYYKRGLDMSVFAFGCSVIGDVVNVSPGAVMHAAHPPVLVNYGYGLSFKLTADHQYVWVEYNLVSHAHPTFGGPSTVEPQSDAQILRVWLALFRLVNGIGSIERVGHVGNIIIPSLYE